MNSTQQSLLVNQTQAAQLLGVCVNTFKARFAARLTADSGKGQKLFARAAVLAIADELKEGSQLWMDSTSAKREKTGISINRLPDTGAFAKVLEQRARKKPRSAL